MRNGSQHVHTDGCEQTVSAENQQLDPTVTLSPPPPPQNKSNVQKHRAKTIKQEIKSADSSYRSLCDL